jgi:hypothetical protein
MFPRVQENEWTKEVLWRLSTFAGEPNNHHQQTPPTIKSSLHDLQIRIKALGYKFSKLTSIYST